MNLQLLHIEKWLLISNNMTKLFFFVELLLFLSCFDWIGSAEVEGVKTCQLLSNSSGFCESIYECPSILNSWKQNNTGLVYCSEENEIVCCPYQVEGQRISEKSKCKTKPLIK